VRYLIVTGWRTNLDGTLVWKCLNTFGSQWAKLGKIDIPDGNVNIISKYVIDV
jgi:hypothetical protein